jgi:hypothetical protein
VFAADVRRHYLACLDAWDALPSKNKVVTKVSNNTYCHILPLKVHVSTFRGKIWQVILTLRPSSYISTTGSYDSYASNESGWLAQPLIHLIDVVHGASAARAAAHSPAVPLPCGAGGVEALRSKGCHTPTQTPQTPRTAHPAPPNKTALCPPKRQCI